MNTLSKVAIVVAGVMCSTGASAKVLMQDTSINAGYWFEMGSDSKASNKENQTVVDVAHRTIADWGSIFVKGLVENLGQLDDDAQGNDGEVTYKTFVTAYYNLGETDFQLWYDEFSVGNENISENHHYLGASYHTKLGKLNAKLGVAADYTFGHTPGGKYEGFNAYASRLDLNYPMMKDLMTFAMVEYRWDIDEEIGSAHGWDDTGYHALIGANYRINQSWDVTSIYHKFDEWGAYNEGGDSFMLTVGYHF